MNDDWQPTKIGTLLKTISRPVVLDPRGSYRLLGAHWYANGLYIKEEKEGNAIRARTLFEVKEGDFVYNRLFAWKGSFAVASKEVDGCVVSSEFPCFTVNGELVDPKFLWLYFSRQSAWNEALGLSSGSTPTSRNRLKESQFLSIEILRPPIEAQRRIVSRVENLVAKIEQARGLRGEATQRTILLLRRATAELLDDGSWQVRPLKELLVEPPRHGLSPQPEIDFGGRPMLRISAVSSAPTRFVDLNAFKRVEVSDERARPYLLQNDDVFIVRYNGDINRVAKAAIYKGSNEGNVVFPDKLIRLRLDKSKMLPDFLVFALGSRSVRQQIEDIGKTTAGNIGISGGNAKAFRIPVPPLNEQRRIVSYLHALQAKIGSLKTLQSENGAGLDALMPSILDKAFRGELN